MDEEPNEAESGGGGGGSAKLQQALTQTPEKCESGSKARRGNSNALPSRRPAVVAALRLRLQLQLQLQRAAASAPPTRLDLRTLAVAPLLCQARQQRIVAFKTPSALSEVASQNGDFPLSRSLGLRSEAKSASVGFRTRSGRAASRPFPVCGHKKRACTEAPESRARLAFWLQRCCTSPQPFSTQLKCPKFHPSPAWEECPFFPSTRLTAPHDGRAARRASPPFPFCQLQDVRLSISHL